MKLMTKELEKDFEKTGEQRDVQDPKVIAKYFYPAGSATWLALEYDPSTKVFYGYVKGLAYDEFGYFSLEELEQVEVRGLKIERDLFHIPQPISKICPELAPKEKSSLNLESKDKDTDLEL